MKLISILISILIFVCLFHSPLCAISPDQYNVFVKSGLGSSGQLSATRASLTVFVKANEEGVIYTCVALHPAQNEPKLMLSVRVSVLSKFLKELF